MPYLLTARLNFLRAAHDFAVRPSSASECSLAMAVATYASVYANTTPAAPNYRQEMMDGGDAALAEFAAAERFAGI